NRHGQRADGGEIAMRSGTIHGTYAVIAFEAEARQPLAAISPAQRLVLNHLIQKILVILTITECDGQHFLRSLRRQLSVGGAVYQVNLLPGRNSDFSLQQ